MRQRLLHTILTLVLLIAADTAGYALFTKVHTPDYYENHARECFRNNQWAEGKQYLDQGWPEFGSMSVMNELMGKYYYHYKKYDKARYYLVRALRDDFSNTQAREIIVNVEEETHNYSSAICYINELLEDNPYSRGWWRRKINIYRKQGNTIEADRLLARLQQIYPNDEVVKKDVIYVNEQRLAKQKHEGDVAGQVETLENLIKAYPANDEYYVQLAGALVQTGRIYEAIEVAGRGAQVTGSVALMEKRAGMLAEQGRYTEAINYLKECIHKHPSEQLSKYLDKIEMSAAENAQLNDPYTSMAKVYSKQHNDDALNYLLNTSIARGYYDDALQYVKEAKERRGETEELLYKEFIVNRRLGNRGRALSCLTKIYSINPGNNDVKEYLCEMRYADASDEMGYGQYTEAMPLLQFVQDNASDQELRRGAMIRLFNCYFETRRYDQAHTQLNALKKDYNYSNYVYHKASLYHAEGRTDKALKFIASEFDKTTDALQALLMAYQYEEYAIPYIKGMMDLGMIRQAHKVAEEAVVVCPTSNDLLHMAIATSDMLGNFDEYTQNVEDAAARCPGDPFFIVKRADVMIRQGDYAGAVNLLRPEVDTFMGDSSLVGAFTDASIRLALDQAKARAYSSAIATLDTALVYRMGDRELLYTKGQIFEKMGQYDSAYVYQRYYKPSFAEYGQYRQHMEELKNNTFRNEVALGFRGGEASVAELSYSRKGRNDLFTSSAGYTTRQGSAAGVSLGLGWRHSFSGTPWSVSLAGSWGSDYFPQATGRLGIEKRLKRQMTLGLHGTYRRLKACYGDTPAFGYRNMAEGGLTWTKRTEMFSFAAEADAAYIGRRCYVGGNVKGVFYPMENSRTNLFAAIGAGNAAPASLLDSGMVCGFGKVGTSLEAGLQWVFNRFLSASLTGSWHNQSLSGDVLTGAWGLAGDAASQPSGYKNIYLLQGKLFIAF